MNAKERILSAILEQYRKHASVSQEKMFKDVLETMSFTNVIIYAQDLGIDTDPLLYPATVFKTIFPTESK